MEHEHSHGPAKGKRLGLSVALTLVFIVGEAGVGLLSNSLALLADAGHNFADALNLLLAWYAIRLSQRPPNDRKTFGYHRATILAALLNACSLVAMAGWIFWEAFHRLMSPPPVESGWMVGVGLAAVGVNVIIGLWLRKEARHDLNIRAAFLHQIGDALAAGGVVVAGILIAVTGFAVIDTLISFLIGGLILWSSTSILTEAIDVLLEATPPSVDLVKLVHAIERTPGVEGVHDLHVWTISSGLLACSCHILVGNQAVSEGQQVQQAVARILSQEFGISHSTIQIECVTCGEGDGLHCPVRNPEDQSAGAG